MEHVFGFRCAVCAEFVDVATTLPWRCPRAVGSDRHHVLEIVTSAPSPPRLADPNPFVAFGPRLAWFAYAAANGMSDEACVALTRELDDQVDAVAGTAFRVSPFSRQDALSDALGFSSAGGIWVKDETHDVGESHKARHLFTVLLHLRAAETLGLAPWESSGGRPPLAIASCGNAAIAAATLADAVGWPIRVFVPPWASGAVLARLRRHRAEIVVCPRVEADPAGDPCILRFREAVAAGAVPFSVQGPENALCLDGGRTLGWEIAAAEIPLDRLMVQVGGGALAASIGASLGSFASPLALHAVQTEGCAPLARAWDLAGRLPGGRSSAAAHWDECMWPWDEAEPASVADGILDDETYDWLGVLSAMEISGGSPVVATEVQVVEAHRLARATTDVVVSATGSAGLAGVLAMRPEIGDDERVAVVFSGLDREG